MPASTTKQDLSATLKRAIEQSGLSNYKIWKLSGVSQSVLNRFTSGERDISLATASKIASALGAELKLSRKAIV